MHLFLSHLQRLDVVDISVISFDYPYQKATYEWDGIKVYALGGNNPSGLLKLWNWQNAIQLSLKLNSRLPIDQIHSFWLNDCALVGNRIAKKIRIPHSCTLMGQDVLKSNRFIKRISPPPKLITLSNFQNTKLFENFSLHPSLTIPWGVEELSAGNENKTIDIIGVGNLNEVKNYSKFIYIIQLVKEEFPQLKVELIGEGEEEYKLKKLVTDLKLTDTISFLGVKNREETLSQMKKAKILLHTANFESFGMVLVEAQSLGLRVVSSPVGISHELKGCDTFDSITESALLICKFLKENSSVDAIRSYKIEDTVQSYLKDVF